MTTSATQSAPPTVAKLKAAAREGSLHEVLSSARLTEEGIRAAKRDGKVPEIIDSDHIAELGEKHLEALREAYSERPRDRALSLLVGRLEQQVLHETTRPAREREIAEDVAARRRANAEYRARPDLDSGGFVAVLEREYGRHCPGGGDPHPLGGYVERIGEWRHRCRLCGFAGDALSVWRKQQATGDD